MNILKCKMLQTLIFIALSNSDGPNKKDLCPFLFEIISLEFFLTLAFIAEAKWS